MVEIKAVSYEQARAEHFETLRDEAKRKTNHWVVRVRRSRPNDLNDPAHIKASEYGMQYSFYNDALEALAAQPKWISVEEALPELCKKVLVAIPHGKYRYKLHVGERWNECWWVEAAKWDYDYIKFWCELPEPPKKEAD